MQKCAKISHSLNVIYKTLAELKIKDQSRVGGKLFQAACDIIGS